MQTEANGARSHALLIEEIAALRGRVAELEAALKPFAAYAAEMDADPNTRMWGNGLPVRCSRPTNEPGPTLGDCRAARRALEGEGK